MSFSVVRTCPALDGNYPRIPAQDAAAASYTANIYDMNAGGAALNASAYTSGTEITVISTAAGAAGILNMGHANVIADWDALTAEGANILVEMIPDSGTTTFCHVIANDAEHVSALYEGQAVYADSASSNVGTAFPFGSVTYPCRNLGDACSILTSRGFAILDCKGSWDSNHSTAGGGVGGCKSADIGGALSTAKATIQTRSTAAFYPHISGDAIDLVNCTVISLVVPWGFSLGNFTNNSYFEGSPKVSNARVQQCNWTGNGAGRSGKIDFKDCLVQGTQTLSAYQSPGCYGADFYRCVWDSNQTINFTSLGGTLVRFSECTGPVTIANLATGKTLNMFGHKGSPTITIASSTSNGATISLSGAIDTVTDQRTGASYALAQLAHTAQLTGNIVNLAPGSITVTEAPNLDAAVTTRATPAQVAAELVTYDAATGAEAAALSAAIATRAAPGDAMALTAGERTTVQGLVLSDATPFAGADVGAILTDTAAMQPTIATNLDATVSTRATPAQVQAELVTYDAATGTEVAAVVTQLTAMSGATFNTSTDSLEAIRDRGDAAWTGGGGGGSTLGPEVIWKAPVLERPSPSATAVYTCVLEVRDAGVLADPDAQSITVTVANPSGTDRSSNLGSGTMTRLRTGQYSLTYSVPYDAAVEELLFTFVAAFSAVTLTYTEVAQVLDTSNTSPSLVLSGV